MSATDETKLWVGVSAKQRRNVCFGPPPVYQGFSTRCDWAVKKGLVDLPIRMEVNSKCISDNSLSPLGTEKKELWAASQTSLTEGELRLLRGLTLGAQLRFSIWH